MIHQNIFHFLLYTAGPYNGIDKIYSVVIHHEHIVDKQVKKSDQILAEQSHPKNMKITLKSAYNIEI